MKKHPAWKNAVEIITERFAFEGYGILFSEEDMNAMLDLQKPAMGTFAEFQKYQLQRLQSLTALKDALLEDHNLCLTCAGNYSYSLTHPDDQVNVVSQTIKKQVRGKINRMIKTLVHTDDRELSTESRNKKALELGKMAFVIAAMNKRRLIDE